MSHVGETEIYPLEDPNGQGGDQSAIGENSAIQPGLSTADLAGSHQMPPEESRAMVPDVDGNGSAATQSPQMDGDVPLFPAAQASELRERWHALQAGFVDEPRSAVEQADSLVAGGMKRLGEQVADERARLESQWDRGDNVSTEDLRLALQRYCSFFGRLLSV